MTNPKDIRIEDYDYPLPDEKIAKHPLAVRDECKLLAYRDGKISEHIFKELPGLLPSPATLVYNNTRVINARLRFTKPSGAKIEIFCLEPVNPADYATNFSATDSCTWKCFVGNSKRWKDGSLTLNLNIDGNDVVLTAVRIRKDDSGSEVKFSWNDSTHTFADIISAAGEIPIPPYLNRDTEDSDTCDYQTVFSRINGSVAAPTAGLHFTSELLDTIDKHGISRLEVTLHVGAGTFQPVKAENIGDHDMHSEFIAVRRETIAALADSASPVIAVGTTSVRTLESLYHIARLIKDGKWDGEVPQWCPYEKQSENLSGKDALKILLDYLDSHNETTLYASTRIIIAPGYAYRIIDGMVTNFHQPCSTLLLLVSAFIGDSWRDVYEFALNNNFRFLSYGDACLFLKHAAQ